jgi:hypothetical protein
MDKPSEEPRPTKDTNHEHFCILHIKYCPIHIVRQKCTIRKFCKEALYQLDRPFWNKPSGIDFDVAIAAIALVEGWDVAAEDLVLS